MTIYLINLDRHSERLAHMREQLDGVAFERISAVDGSTRPATMKGLTRFELACLESHRIAWRNSSPVTKASRAFLRTTRISSRASPHCSAKGNGRRTPHTVKLDTLFQTVRLGERLK